MTRRSLSREDMIELRTLAWKEQDRIRAKISNINKGMIELTSDRTTWPKARVALCDKHANLNGICVTLSESIGPDAEYVGSP